MGTVMSPKIVLTITGSNGHAPLPSTCMISGSAFTVWSSTGSLSMAATPAIEYRDRNFSRLVVVQKVNTGSYAGQPALLSIAWVPTTLGDTINSTFSMMSSQFIAEGLIHKRWDSLAELVADSSAQAVAAKAAWPSTWSISGSLYIGSVLA